MRRLDAAFTFVAPWCFSVADAGRILAKDSSLRLLLFVAELSVPLFIGQVSGTRLHPALDRDVCPFQSHSSSGQVLGIWNLQSGIWNRPLVPSSSGIGLSLQYNHDNERFWNLSVPSSSGIGLSLSTTRRGSAYCPFSPLFIGDRSFTLEDA